MDGSSVVERVPMESSRWNTLPPLWPEGWWGGGAKLRNSLVSVGRFPELVRSHSG